MPDLAVVVPHAALLPGLHVTAATDHAGVLRRVSSEWTVSFTYQGHEFSIYTNYHAGLTHYAAADPDCPETLLRAVVAHFDAIGLPVPTWVAPPPLSARRLAVFLLIALAVALPLVIFLTLFRKP